jgi:RNA polymerase sigma-70 factor (ECF subfamily)
MGREEAFVQLIQENEGVIYKITMVYTDNLHDRQDLYQEIVYQLWKGYDSFLGKAKFSTWMYRVAMNTAISQLKKRKRQPNTLPPETLIGNASDLANPEFEERIRMLYAHIGELSILEKGIILLFLEGKKYHEIAEITGLSATNIGTRISRIKLKLKNRIKKEL